MDSAHNLNHSYRMATPGEVEVFRLTPEVGKCYKHAEYTREIGRYPNARYFFMGQPRYVGKFVKELRYGGYGDGQTIIAVFNDNGVENRVNYSYEGRTSFVEVPCQEPSPENKARKGQALGELKSMPPLGDVFPGGKNYHNAKAHFEAGIGRSRRNRRSRRNKRRSSRSRRHRR